MEEREQQQEWAANPAEEGFTRFVRGVTTPVRSGRVTITKSGFWRRFAAYTVDRTILDVIFALLFLVERSSSGEAGIEPEVLLAAGDGWYAAMFSAYMATLVISAFYFSYFIGALGQTPGKMLMGIKVVRPDGSLLGWKRAFIRWVGYYISAIILYLGFLLAAVDANKQALHDKLVGSIVVRTK